MGHDFVKYNRDGELLNDLDLWILRHFFLQAVRAKESAQPSLEASELRGFFESWEWLGLGVFTGTDLAQFVSEQRPRWGLLLEVAQSAADRISDFGASIPQSYLTEQIQTPMVRYGQALPTKPLLACIGRVCKLLSRHEPRAA